MMYKAALIGLGNIAWRFDRPAPEPAAAKTQAGAMLAHPKVALLGGCSPSGEDRRAFGEWSSGLPAFDDVATLLARLQPDIVGVCSPTELHFRHAAQCLEAGVRALWLEKPPAHDAGSLRELAAIAARTKATVLVNYIRRYLPAYERLRNAYREKRYGPCRLVRVLYSPGLARNGVHLLDQLFHLSNSEGYDLQWVEKTTGGSPGFSLRLDDGTLVQASGADVPYHTNDIALVCERGIASVLRGGKIVKTELAGENDLFPGFYDLHDADGEDGAACPVEGYMDAALADLVRCMESGRQPRSSLASALPSQKLLEDILERAGT
ncbi:MAG: Gfo/Idh/MocA family oxidoreductase [Planctomycetota bacterium]|jgi:predicted dehydrogenase|nr:Gfo/Idh/MocA family oxidoreductase [Planctomycetota bacterium]